MKQEHDIKKDQNLEFKLGKKKKKLKWNKKKIAEQKSYQLGAQKSP